MEFSQIVKSLRLERGWSQQEVADRAGLNKMTISQYENGKRKPSFEVIEALAEIFHVDMNYLLGYTEARTRRSSPSRARLPTASSMLRSTALTS